MLSEVSQYFDAERVSRAGSPLVSSLLANLKHQQWKATRFQYGMAPF